MCLVSSPLSGWASAPQGGRRRERSEAGLVLYRVLGRMGTLAEQLAPMGGNDHGTTWHSDPLGLPQVNNSVEFLGERKGYAPFSPDENSLVLFDGRAI